MTILLSLPASSFAPQTQDFVLSVAPEIQEFRVSLTHGDWPEGECIRCDVLWDGGAATGQVRLGGGVVRDKAGNPIGGTKTTTWSCYKPAGVTGGTRHLQIVQALNTAVLIEGF